MDLEVGGVQVAKMEQPKAAILSARLTAIAQAACCSIELEQSRRDQCDLGHGQQAGSEESEGHLP